MGVRWKFLVACLLCAVLQSPGRWFYYNKSIGSKRDLHKITHETSKDWTVYLLLLAAKTLQAIGLGKVVRTKDVSGGGRPNCFFAKRDVDVSMHFALGVFGISPSTTPSLASYAASILADKEPPVRAPVLIWSASPVPLPAKADILLLVSAHVPRNIDASVAERVGPRVDGIDIVAVAPASPVIAAQSIVGMGAVLVDEDLVHTDRPRLLHQYESSGDEDASPSFDEVNLIQTPPETPPAWMGDDESDRDGGFGH